MHVRVGVFVLGTISVFVSLGVAAGADYPDSTLIEAITNIQHQILDDHFDKAGRLSKQLAATRPDDPSGHLMAATALLAEMTDREEPLHKKQFERMLSAADSLADCRLEDSQAERHRAWMRLVRGHVRALRSIFEARFESLASALRHGLAARKEYQRGLDLDSLNIDLYAGLGAYHYWKSAKAGLLRWIGIFSNDRERGLTELQRASTKSLVSQQSTRAALCWVWLDLHEYDSVVAIAGELGARFPDGKSFRWALAEAYEAWGEHGRAAALYDSLANQYALNPGNYVNLIETDYRAARNWELAEQPDRLGLSAARLTEYARFVPSGTRSRQKGKIRTLEKFARQFPPTGSSGLASDSL